jgi:hypothetical protein
MFFVDKCSKSIQAIIPSLYPQGVDRSWMEKIYSLINFGKHQKTKKVVAPTTTFFSCIMSLSKDVGG